MDIMASRLRKTGPDQEPSADAPEGVRAHWWRENVLRMSRPQLADKIGRSVSYIESLELGTRPPEDFTAYRLLCAAVWAGLEFDWRHCRARIGGASFEIG